MVNPVYRCMKGNMCKFKYLCKCEIQIHYSPLRVGMELSSTFLPDSMSMMVRMMMSPMGM